MLFISLSFVFFDSTLKKKFLLQKLVGGLAPPLAGGGGGWPGTPSAPPPPPAPVSTALSVQEVLLEEGEMGNLEEWSSVI